MLAAYALGAGSAPAAMFILNTLTWLLTATAVIYWTERLVARNQAAPQG